MQALEQQLRHRHPRWFVGPRAALVRTVLRGLGKWSRLDAVERFLDAHRHVRDFDFVSLALEHFDLRYRINDRDLAAVPAVGRLLIVANHPSGALDGLALLDAVGRVRRDVRIVANDVLSLLEPMSGLFLPVSVFGGHTGAERLRAIEAALEREECVIVFPAGEVSRLGLRGIRDRRWRPGFARFARRTGTPVLPVRIDARNSALFYGAAALYGPAGTALLAREMFARRPRPLQLHMGRPMRLAMEDTPEDCVRRVRRAVYALGRDAASAPAQEPLAAPTDRAAVLMAISTTELLGRTGDGKDIRLARLQEDSPLLLEIGRLRELTFREVGEGTGRARDLDAFDADYDHLLVWDAAAGRIAGAYRVARGAPMLARRGLAGLYTASLFHYTDEALPRIAQGMELGRSFVVPDYWGSRSLDYLWQGIGAYLRRHPQVRYLFGAVSISAALPREAREQLVAYYDRYYGDRGGAAALRPFRHIAAPPHFGDLDADGAFELLKANLAAHGTTVPVLYRQYTDLCEPGGARFLAFGVDPDFSDSIDGLIEVDLARILPKKRQRYLQPRDTSAAAA